MSSLDVDLECSALYHVNFAPVIRKINEQVIINEPRELLNCSVKVVLSSRNLVVSLSLPTTQGKYHPTMNLEISSQNSLLGVRTLPSPRSTLPPKLLNQDANVNTNF